MPGPDWERFRPGAVIGRREYGYREVGSTMDVAWELAEAGAEHGTAVVAGAQTHGRGRFDRPWLSSAGGSLLASVVLRPDARVAPLLTIVGCLAVQDAVRELTGLECSIKWPNDVQAGGGKLCGVIAEGRTDTAGKGAAVLGIGLNLDLDLSQLPELAGIATSLRAETGQAIDVRSAAAAVFRNIEALYADADAGGDVAGRWRRALGTLGRRVTVRSREVTLSGVAEDVDHAGRLLLRSDDGVLHALSEGDVTLAE